MPLPSHCIFKTKAAGVALPRAPSPPNTSLPAPPPPPQAAGTRATATVHAHLPPEWPISTCVCHFVQTSVSSSLFVPVWIASNRWCTMFLRSGTLLEPLSVTWAEASPAPWTLLIRGRSHCLTPASSAAGHPLGSCEHVRAPPRFPLWVCKWVHIETGASGWEQASRMEGPGIALWRKKHLSCVSAWVV